MARVGAPSLHPLEECVAREALRHVVQRLRHRVNYGNDVRAPNVIFEAIEQYASVADGADPSFLVAVCQPLMHAAYSEYSDEELFTWTTALPNVREEHIIARSDAGYVTDLGRIFKRNMFRLADVSFVIMFTFRDQVLCVLSLHHQVNAGHENIGVPPEVWAGVPGDGSSSTWALAHIPSKGPC